MEENINHGVIEQEPQGFDWIAGAETGIAFIERMPAANWEKFLSDPELQKSSKTDFMDCVTQSFLNELEAQFNWMAFVGAFTAEQIHWLTRQGYLIGGKFNFSKRFTAKMSGTTIQGNSAQNVGNSARHDGLLPESDWPVTADMSWAEHYAEIPQALKDKAKKILEIVEIAYEFVYIKGALGCQEAIKKHIKQAPLQILAPVCSPWNTTEIIKSCGKAAAEHATTIYKFEDLKVFNDFDHYNPVLKRLDWDYYIPYVVKGVVSIKKEAVIPTKLLHEFTTTLKYGQNAPEITLLQDALKLDGDMSLKVPSTGYYGNITAQAVMGFQRKHNVADEAEIVALQGRQVGPKTRAKLNDLFNK